MTVQCCTIRIVKKDGEKQFLAKIRQEARVCSHESYNTQNWKPLATFLSETLWGLSSVTLMQLAPKATTLGEMMQNNCYYVVQHH